MYKLYHHTLCPFSRKVRTHMNCKNLEYELLSENFWLKNKDLIALNPAGQVPILRDLANDNVISGSDTIIEYLEEKYNQENNFLGGCFSSRAEVRRLQNWFDDKFYAEVTSPIIHERYLNRFLPDAKAPNPNILSIARNNLAVHFSYIDFLLQNSRYLAGENISVADFAAAGQISVLDYFSDINWQYYENVKEWYSMIKSQKSFSEILKDSVSTVTPPNWYSKLDF